MEYGHQVKDVMKTEADLLPLSHGVNYGNHKFTC